MFATPRLESIDIDEEADWRLAEALLGTGVSSL
jgi:CMP-N-acetylneuraminic acid synthetase